MRMESKEYFEKVMQDYNQHRNGRSLRKYCRDEAIDYDWLIEFKKTYPERKEEASQQPMAGFIPLTVSDGVVSHGWQVSQLTLLSPEGATIEIKSNNLQVVAELLQKMS